MRAPRPWYREPWPWLLMSGPAAAVAAGAFTFYLAATTSDGLVADDYYKQGLAINQVIRRTDSAARRRIEADVVVDDESRSVRVTLRGQFAPGAPPVLRLVHPTRAASDQLIALHAVNAGTFEGGLLAPGPGRWRVVLENPEWRVSGVWTVPGARRFALAPERPVPPGGETADRRNAR